MLSSEFEHGKAFQHGVSDSQETLEYNSLVPAALLDSVTLLNDTTRTVAV